MAQPFEDIKSPGFHISKKWLLTFTRFSGQTVKQHFVAQTAQG